jgi:hypothetical protein
MCVDYVRLPAIPQTNCKPFGGHRCGVEPGRKANLSLADLDRVVGDCISAAIAR